MPRNVVYLPIVKIIILKYCQHYKNWDNVRIATSETANSHSVAVNATATRIIVFKCNLILFTYNTTNSVFKKWSNSELLEFAVGPTRSFLS